MYFSAIFIEDLIDYAAKNGLSAEELAASNIKSGKQKYVSYDAIVQTLNAIKLRLEDEYLGLHLGEHISLKTTAYVDNIMLNSKTLEESIINAIEYSKLISDALECSFQKTAHHFSVIYEENPNWKVHQKYARRQILDVALLSNVKSLAAYTNRRYFPVRIHFNYEKPRDINEYYRLFNCSLKFKQPKTEIIYEKQLIDHSSKEIKFGLLESLKEKVAEEINNLPAENELIYQLKKCILKHKPKRILIGEAASLLLLSSRSLQRKLKQMDTTFKEIEYELQLKLAKTYLEEKQKSIDEISYLLGFSESSAFIRFFKSLSAKTPKEYQRAVSKS